MIVTATKFAIENGLKMTGVEGCIKAFKGRLEGHVETKGKEYLLDDEACEIILEIIKERELLFFSSDLQKEDKKLWDDRMEIYRRQNEASTKHLNITLEIIELERKLRELEKEQGKFEKQLVEIELEKEKFEVKRAEFQKEAYKKYVFKDDESEQKIMGM